MRNAIRNNLLLTLFICVALHAQVLGNEVEVVIKGAGTKTILVNDSEFKFKVDFSGIDMDKFISVDYGTPYYLYVGGCPVRLWGNHQCPEGTDHDGYKYKGKHIGFDYKGDKPWFGYIHDTVLNATVVKADDFDDKSQRTTSKIKVTNPSNVINPIMSCNIDRQKSDNGKVIIKVEVTSTGEPVDPNLVVTFNPSEAPPTTTTELNTLTPEPTTTPETPSTTLEPTTERASSSSPSTSTSLIVPTLKAPCPQCEDRGLAGWLIGLIAAVIVLALLAIILCAVLFFCYRRMKEAKNDAKNNKTVVASTMSTVSTAPGPLVKETNLYGPDMMYFGRDATPMDPKSQGAGLAPQSINQPPQVVSPAPAVSPLPGAQ